MHQYFRPQDQLTTQFVHTSSTFLNTRPALLAAAANSVRLVDLDSRTSRTLALQLSHNIQLTAVSFDDEVLIAIDQTGQSVVYHLPSESVIGFFNFKEKVHSVVFAHSAHMFAANLATGLKVYSVPSLKRNFEPLFMVKKVMQLHSKETIGCAFSSDDRFLLTWGRDLLLKLSSVFYIPRFVPFQFAVHKQRIVTAFMDSALNLIYSLDSSGVVYVWKWVEDYLTEEYMRHRENKGSKRPKLNEGEFEEAIGPLANDLQKRILKGRYIMEKKYNFGISGTRIKAAAVRWPFVFVGYKSGALAVIRLPLDQPNPLQTVTFEFSPTSISADHSGKWVALGSQSREVVYQWKSRSIAFTNVFQKVTAVDLGQNTIVAGGTGLSVYSLASGFNLATLSNDEIKAVAVRGQLAVGVTAFGEVLAFDLNKNICFRRMKPDSPNQIQTVAIDSSSELVCAGGFDPYEVYVWNLRTGNLLMKIAVHEGPISCLAFVEATGFLASGSWDKTVRIHQLTSKTMGSEILQHTSDVVALATHPTRNELASSTTGGELYLWQLETLQVKGVIPVALDLQPGRNSSGLMTAKKDDSNRYLRCISYSPCGQFLMGGGRGKHFLVYGVASRHLLARICLTESKDLDSVTPKLNSRVIRDGINTAELSVGSEASDYEDRKDKVVPGSLRKDATRRNRKVPMECFSLKVTRDRIIVASSFGLQLLSYPQGKIFTPKVLQGSPNDLPRLLGEKQWVQAVLLAANLSLPVAKVLRYIPISQKDWVLSNLSLDYVKLIGQNLSQGHVDELGLGWLESCLQLTRFKVGSALEGLREADEACIALVGAIDSLSSFGCLSSETDCSA